MLSQRQHRGGYLYVKSCFWYHCACNQSHKKRNLSVLSVSAFHDYDATCKSFVFVTLLSWLPSYLHDEFPESKSLLFNDLPWVASFMVNNVCGVVSDNVKTSDESVRKTRKIFVGILLIAPTVSVLS